MTSNIFVDETTKLPRSIDETAAFVHQLLKKQAARGTSGMTETEATKRAIIAERLKEARKLAGISQGHVAKILGLHRPSISGMESGKRRVSAYELARLAEIYDVGVSWLLGRGAGDP